MTSADQRSPPDARSRLLLRIQGQTRRDTAIDPQPVSLQSDAQAGVVRQYANRMNMQDNVVARRAPWALHWAIRISCIAVVLSLTTMHSEQAYAQNASTAPNVKPETRAKVERIRLKYPEFKLPRDEQECLDGKLIDPDCDPVINDQVDLFVRKRVLDERGRAVDERERELANVKLAGEHIDVVWGLVQLGLFAFDDRVPPKNADFVNIVMKSQTTSTDVRSLFNDFLGRKNRGEKFSSKADSERLLSLADKHLESANALKAQITKDETFKKQVTALYLQAASSLEMAKQILAQKARP